MRGGRIRLSAHGHRLVHPWTGVVRRWTGPRHPPKYPLFARLGRARDPDRPGAVHQVEAAVGTAAHQARVDQGVEIVGAALPAQADEVAHLRWRRPAAGVDHDPAAELDTEQLAHRGDPPIGQDRIVDAEPGACMGRRAAAGDRLGTGGHGSFSVAPASGGSWRNAPSAGLVAQFRSRLSSGHDYGHDFRGLTAGATPAQNQPPRRRRSTPYGGNRRARTCGGWIGGTAGERSGPCATRQGLPNRARDARG